MKRNLPLFLLLVAALAAGLYLMTQGAGTASEPAVSQELPALPGGGDHGAPIEKPGLEISNRPEGAPPKAPGGRRVAERETAPMAPQGVRGRVWNAFGAPAKGAHLYLLREVPPSQMLQVLAMMQARGGKIRPRIVAEGRSDEAGRFELAAPPSLGEAGYELHVVAPNHVIQRRKLRIQEGRWLDLGLIRLEAGKVLRGRVRDKRTKAPIAGAVVEIRPSTANLLTPTPGFEDGIRVQTGSQGFYEAKGLPDGPFSLKAYAKDYGTILRPDLAFSANEQVLTVDLELPKGFEIDGWVLDADGKPIAGAQVEAIPFSAAHPTPGKGISGQDGRFAVLGLDEGRYTLRATAPGFAPTEKKPVKAGDKEVQIVLERQGSVLLRVTDHNGRPVRNYRAELRTWFEGQDNYGRSSVPPVEVRGARRGEHLITGVEAGNYVVLVEAVGYARTFSRKFTVANEQSEPVVVPVTVSKGGTITGVVLDAAGRPVKGASVHSLPAEYQDNPFTRMLGALMTFKVTRKTAVTDGRGRFVLDLLAPGTYQLRVDHPAYARLYKKPFAVRADERLDAGRLVLHQGAKLEGVVMYKGAPVPGAEVNISAQFENNQMVFEKVFADAQGRFRVNRRLRPGTYEIQASRTDLANPILKLADIQRSLQRVELYEGRTHRVVIQIKDR